MTLETTMECLDQLLLLKEDTDVTKEDLVDLIAMMIEQDDVVMPLDDMIYDRGVKE